MPQPQPGRFTPTNRPAENLWFRLELAALCRTLADNLPCLSDHYLRVTAEEPPQQAGSGIRLQKNLPEIVNNHLQYAITWFSLALVLVVVFGLVVWREVKRSFGSSPNPRIE